MANFFLFFPDSGENNNSLSFNLTETKFDTSNIPDKSENGKSVIQLRKSFQNQNSFSSERNSGFQKGRSQKDRPSSSSDKSNTIIPSYAEFASRGDRSFKPVSPKNRQFVHSQMGRDNSHEGESNIHFTDSISNAEIVDNLVNVQRGNEVYSLNNKNIANGGNKDTSAFSGNISAELEYKLKNFLPIHDIYHDKGPTVPFQEIPEFHVVHGGVDAVPVESNNEQLSNHDFRKSFGYTRVQSDSNFDKFNSGINIDGIDAFHTLSNEDSLKNNFSKEKFGYTRVQSNQNIDRFNPDGSLSFKDSYNAQSKNNDDSVENNFSKNGFGYTRVQSNQNVDKFNLDESLGSKDTYNGQSNDDSVDKNFSKNGFGYTRVQSKHFQVSSKETPPALKTFGPGDEITTQNEFHFKDEDTLDDFVVTEVFDEVNDSNDFDIGEENDFDIYNKNEFGIPKVNIMDFGNFSTDEELSKDFKTFKGMTVNNKTATFVLIMLNALSDAMNSSNGTVFPPSSVHNLQPNQGISLPMQEVPFPTDFDPPSSNQDIRHGSFLGYSPPDPLVPPPVESPVINIFQDVPSLTSACPKRKPVTCPGVEEGFCLDDYQYPIDAIESALQDDFSLNSKYAEVTFQSADDLVTLLTKTQEENFNYSYYNPSTFDESHWFGPGGYVCPSKVSYSRPLRARNAEGEWRLILNDGKFYTQTVRLETCLYPNTPCRLIAPCFRSLCLQKYTYHRLLALDPCEPSKESFIDIFRLPSSCSCYAPDFFNLMEYNG